MYLIGKWSHTTYATNNKGEKFCSPAAYELQESAIEQLDKAINCAPAARKGSGQ